MHVIGFNLSGIKRLAFSSLTLAILAGVAAVAPFAVVHADERQFERPAVIEFSGPVDWNNATYLQTRISRAKSRGADLVIIKIDSPGGLARESLRLGELLRDIDWAHSVAWIEREAISGAALISLGCDDIVVSPNSVFGDIGAIFYDVELQAFRYVPEKIRSVLITQARELARANGHPGEMVEAMIDRDVLLFAGRGDRAGEFRTVRLRESDNGPDEAADRAGLDPGEWEFVPESDSSGFLTLPAGRAVELGLAPASIDSVSDLMQHYSANAENVITFRYNATDAVVYVLNSTAITVLLVVIGIIALYIEFSAPGIGAGGLIAFLCAALFFWSRFMGGTSGTLEIVLFLCGIAFLLMEVFVIPGWGISGFIGLALILGSAVMAGLDFVVPESATQWNELISNVLVILCSGVAGLISLAWVARHVSSIPVMNSLILEPRKEPDNGNRSRPGKDGKPAMPAHPLVDVGDWGVAESVLRPAGRVRFGHQSIDVVSEGSFVDPGNQVRVVSIRGNQIVVQLVESEESDS